MLRIKPLPIPPTVSTACTTSGMKTSVPNRSQLLPTAPNHLLTTHREHRLHDLGQLLAEEPRVRLGHLDEHLQPLLGRSLILSTTCTSV